MADKTKQNTSEPRTVQIPATTTQPKNAKPIKSGERLKTDDKTRGDIKSNERTKSGERAKSEERTKSGERTKASDNTKSIPKTKAVEKTSAKPADSITVEWEQKSEFRKKLEHLWSDITFRWMWLVSAVGIYWRRFLELAKTKLFILIASGALALIIALTSVIVYYVHFAPLGFIPVGINISDNSYSSRQLMFTDAFLTASAVLDEQDHQEGYFPLDDYGYPLEVPFNGRQAVFYINNGYLGEYTLLYDGSGDFDAGEGVEIVSKIENRCELRLVEAENQRYITITLSNPMNPIKDIRIVPKSFAGRESRMPLFRDDFLHGLRGMHALRFADAIRISNSTQVKWSDRPQEGQFGLKGVPYECLISLCNTLMISGWFNVPHMASDDYILSLARLLKGSLNKKLTAYIEYSNDVFNLGLQPAAYLATNAPAAQDAYVSVNLQAIESEGFGLAQKAAYMMKRTFLLVESEFKDARGRIVTVGTVNSSSPNEVRGMVNYWVKNQCVPDAVGGTGFFGYETSAADDEVIPTNVIQRNSAADLDEYFHNKWNADPTEVKCDDVIGAVYALWDYTIAPNIYQTAAIVKSSGARYFVYAGGQNISPHNQMDWQYNQAIFDAQTAPRMYDLYTKNLKMHREQGCDLFMAYNYVGERDVLTGGFGLLENQGDVYNRNRAPKFNAVYNANTRKGYKNK